MKVRVKAFAMLRDMVGKESLIDLPDGSTVRNLLDRIASRHRDFQGHVFASDGSLSSFVTVLVNGRNILHIDGLQTLISDGDEVAIFPPVAGG
jgi:molybdopterin synthase sulfur carrier subunit